ncbi:MAG: hypothetical protein JSR29_11585 [Nitrospira sp.]|nr:hypothetical protein [Nitrospira sp.]
MMTVELEAPVRVFAAESARQVQALEPELGWRLAPHQPVAAQMMWEAVEQA